MIIREKFKKKSIKYLLTKRKASNFMQELLFGFTEVQSQETTLERINLVRNKNLVVEPKTIGPYALNTVQQMDCIEGMRALPSLSIDIAIVDPPYNASKGNVWEWNSANKLPGFGGNWSKVMATWDNMPLADYLFFTLSWLSELKRVIRPTGSLWIHGTYHNIGIINFALQLLKIEIINEIIWYKCNSFPNLSGRRLTASHETILWAHTGKERKYFFNYEATKRMACPEDDLKKPGKQMRTVWSIPNNKDRVEIEYGKHPTQKPLRLLNRMLAISAKQGQICLIPFAGSGSECVAAFNNELYFIAFEKDPNYVEICNKRLKAIPQFISLNKRRNGISILIPPSKTAQYAKPNNDIKRNIPSLIKWTGSKRSQSLIIASHIPEHDRYFEPFLGSGAVLYLMAKPGSVAGDIYEPLIQLWHLVQNDKEALIDNYRKQWHLLQKHLPEYFYKVRDRFNASNNPFDLNFLLRTCVNGIVRFNDKGEFNNSFHLSRPGMHPDRFESVVNNWHDAVKNVKFVCRDYANTLKEACYGDFAYLDPPYLGSKQRYTENTNKDRFYTVLEDLNQRGVKWALSFDGRRGGRDLTQPIPRELYKRSLLIASGNSAIGKVLNGPVELVEESLYMNY